MFDGIPIWLLQVNPLVKSLGSRPKGRRFHTVPVNSTPTLLHVQFFRQIIPS